MRTLLDAWALFGAAVLLSAGCARQEPPTPEPASGAASSPGTPAAARADASSEPAAEPPAESGLSIKRGVMMLAHDRSTFRPCNENSELWVLDQTDGVLARTFAGESAAEPASSTMLYIEAYGERAPADPEIPRSAGYAGVFVLEEVLYAGLQAEVRGCADPEPDYIVGARGTEPFWAVEVNAAQIIWRQPDEPKEIILSAEQMQDAEGAVRYRASGEGHDIDVLIDARPCRDAMSGEFFAYSAKVLLDGKEVNGCARVGR